MPESHSTAPEITASTGGVEAEIAAEQAYVTLLYQRLDQLRDEADERFSSSLAPSAIRTPQAQSDRDVFARLYGQRTRRLSAVEHGLVIGRVDFDDAESFYVGRIGLSSVDHDPLLIDWRAPAATVFYRATPAERLGVRRRRHIHLHGRRVVHLDDDVLAFEDLDEAEYQNLTGEAALLSSLRSPRTGRMSDIVATIQAEQDRVIRSELGGVLVVEGGPGTGKTVVALHRAAYLLYTHRDHLAGRGVLVVGPNSTFLSYIDQVLPGLGETNVVMTSVGELYPGVTTARPDPDDTAVVKGDLRMVDVLQNAVAHYQRVPTGGLQIRGEREPLVLDEEACRRIRDAARERAAQSGQPHNRVRRFVVSDVLDELTQLEVDRAEAVLEGVDVPEETDDEVDHDIAELIDRDTLRYQLRTSPAVRDALDVLWPELTPERVLADLLTDPRMRAEVASQFSTREQDALHRTEGEAWTVADVPLLDELAGLVGELDATIYQATEERVRAQIERAHQTTSQRERIQDAHGVVNDMLVDEEVTIPVDAGEVLARYHDTDGSASVAEHAAGDREWVFGHVIVDEAQELSPMVWHVLGRRCPTLSMTVVGDVAQTGAAEGASRWEEVLDAVAAGRWRRGQLTINYRTPEPIMALAADVLAASGQGGVAPRSVRPDGDAPWAYRVRDDQISVALPAVVRREREVLGEGTLVCVVPQPRLDSCAAAVQAAYPWARTAADEDVLDAPVALLTPGQVKGLEFDGAIVVEPAEILAASSRGHSDLYVALTRPTRRLGVMHTGVLPAQLARLENSADSD